MYEAFSYSCCDKCMRPSATSVCEALSYLGGGGAVAERPSESKVKVASAFDDL